MFLRNSAKNEKIDDGDPRWQSSQRHGVEKPNIHQRLLITTAVIPIHSSRKPLKCSNMADVNSKIEATKAQVRTKRFPSSLSCCLKCLYLYGVALLSRETAVESMGSFIENEKNEMKKRKLRVVT